MVAIFCGNLAVGCDSTINGTGEQTRDYVYVGDVARANVLALEGEAPPGAYNVGTGVETSVNVLYETLRNVSGRDLPPEHGPAKPGEQLRSSIDPAAARDTLGWRPEIGLDAGLRETLKLLRGPGELAARRVFRSRRWTRRSRTLRSSHRDGPVTLASSPLRRRTGWTGPDLP